MEIDNEDAWILLISTVRYSMGRQTYMSSLAPELVLRYNKALTLAQLTQIRDEIASELSRYENMGKLLGDKSDHICWKKAEKDISDMIESRALREKNAGKM